VTALEACAAILLVLGSSLVLRALWNADPELNPRGPRSLEPPVPRRAEPETPFRRAA